MYLSLIYRVWGHQVNKIKFSIILRRSFMEPKCSISPPHPLGNNQSNFYHYGVSFCLFVFGLFVLEFHMTRMIQLLLFCLTFFFLQQNVFEILPCNMYQWCVLILTAIILYINIWKLTNPIKILNNPKA